MFPELATANPKSAGQKALRYFRRCDPKGRWFKRDGAGPTSPFRVTEQQLRTHCPELFNGRDEIAMQLLPHINHLQQGIDDNSTANALFCNELVGIKKRLADVERVSNLRRTSSH